MKNFADVMPNVSPSQEMQHQGIDGVLEREAAIVLRKHGIDPKQVRFSVSEIAGARRHLNNCAKCEADGTSPEECKMHGYRPVVITDADKRQVSVARAKCPKYEGAVMAKRRREVHDRLIGEIPKKLQGKTFKSFSLEGGSDILKRAREAAFNAAMSRRSIVLAGSTGTGKTHLAAAIVHYALKDGRTAILKNVPALMDRFKLHFDDRKQYFELLHCVFDADLLVLDDMGAEKQSQWCDEMLFKIIDARYLEDRQTVITTNYPTPNALVKYMGANGQRIVSRLLEMGAWVTIDAPDWRTAKAAALRND